MDQQPPDETLNQIIEGLSTDYYSPLEKVCNDIHEQLRRNSNKFLLKDYAHHSKLLCKEVENYVLERKEHHLPYLNELSGKERSGHDCTNCSHKCGVQHSKNVMEISMSVSRMRSTASYLKTELDVLDKEFEGMILLRKQVKDLIILLYELLQKEENLLIPTILNVQKKINAGV